MIGPGYDAALEPHVLRAATIGSRVVPGAATPTSDWDYILQTVGSPEEIHDQLVALGYRRHDGLGVAHDRHYGLELFSYTRDNVNLILTDEDLFYERTILAAYITKILRLRERWQRILVYRAIRDGRAYIPDTNRSLSLHEINLDAPNDHPAA